MSQRLSFYLDFGAEVPLWWEGSGMVLPSQLPLTEAVVADLRAFQNEFEDTSAEAGEPTDAAVIAHGRELLHRVRAELGASWDVHGAFEFAERR